MRVVPGYRRMYRKLGTNVLRVWGCYPEGRTKQHVAESLCMRASLSSNLISLSHLNWTTRLSGYNTFLLILNSKIRLLP